MTALRRADVASDELHVWLGETLVATLLRTRTELRLRYTEEALAEFGEGSVALSVALPVTGRRHRGTPVGYWAESLLPEGETRTALEQMFGVRRGDTFGLLSAIGADCAGAVSFLPPGMTPRQTIGSAQALDADDLAGALRELPAHPLGVDEDVRVSLGGLQAKLLLVRTPERGWARPAGGAPSTHIAKPDPPAFPGLVVAEAFTLALAGEAGVAASESELHTWGDRPVLVVRRFDRALDGDRVVRVHQEDGCAALGINPDGRHKYQSLDPDSPTLLRIARVLSRHGVNRRKDLEDLAAAATVRVAVGDTDGHARNYGLLHQRHTVALAPLYDVAPTFAFTSTRQMGLWVGGQSYLPAITCDHLTREFRSWGMPDRLAQELPRNLLERLQAALPAAQDAVPEVDPQLVEKVHDRIARLLKPERAAQ